MGTGEHESTIKSIVWNVDYNILTTCDDKTIRWWDLRTQQVIASVKTEKEITSCELSTNKAEDSDPGILSVAAGHSCLFFDAGRPGELLKQVNFDHDVASVAINTSTGRFVTGGRKDPWVRVWDFAQEKELGMSRTLHGLPHALTLKQKYSKAIMVRSGPSRFPLTANSMQPGVKMGR